VEHPDPAWKEEEEGKGRAEAEGGGSGKGGSRRKQEKPKPKEKQSTPYRQDGAQAHYGPEGSPAENSKDHGGRTRQPNNDKKQTTKQEITKTKGGLNQAAAA
jgi:hypothetical protein